MRILEVGRNVKQVSEVKLGDELELRIDVNHPYSKTFLFIAFIIILTLNYLNNCFRRNTIKSRPLDC